MPKSKEIGIYTTSSLATAVRNLYCELFPVDISDIPSNNKPSVTKFYIIRISFLPDQLNEFEILVKYFQITLAKNVAFYEFLVGSDPYRIGGCYLQQTQSVDLRSHRYRAATLLYCQQHCL